MFSSQLPALCDFAGSTWLVISENVPPLVYYSHLPITIISIFLGLYIFLKNPKGLQNRILFCLTLAFSAWVFLDSVFWATNRSDVIMFVWSLQILFEPLVYISAFYLLYVFVTGQDLSFGKKLFITLLYLPIIIAVPTHYGLTAFNLETCLSEESSVIIYLSYGFELFMALWILIFAVKESIKAKVKDVRDQIIFLTIGTLLLLLSFSYGNIVSSFTEDWNFAQIGLFAMPIFIGFLVYTIIKFKTFNIKLLSAQALIFSQGAIIGALLFVEDLSTIRILIGISLGLILILGITIIRGVKREVSLRESLQEANQGQANLMHFMNHQIKGRLGNAKNVFAELLTNDYGEMPADSKPLLQKGLEETEIGIDYVQSILKGASAESGQLPYDMKPIDFKTVVEMVAEKQMGYAKSKNLKFDVDIAEGDYHITGDALQLREAIKNLVDNSINYTPEGSIEVRLSQQNGAVRFVVKDTGVGISSEDRPKLFKSGGRGVESLKVNVNATGYGLVFVKGVAEAHKGRVWVESEGKGKGSTFFFELPKS